MKNGFTLVELSIVLVIVGLLVGGILVGQSLVDSAKLNAQVRQFQQLAIGYQLFRDKFRELPGDSRYFQDRGDGNGLIENIGFEGTMVGFTLDGERANFWKHLGESQILQESYSNEPLNVDGVLPGVNMPESEIRGDVGLDYAIWNGGGKNRIGFLPRKDTDGDNSVRTFTPAEALSIDAKLDDGLAGADAGEDVGTFFGLSECVNGTSYNIDSGNEVCSIIIYFSIFDVDDQLRYN